jgi:hypothetical protein
MTIKILAVKTITFSLILGALYLSAMLQTNHPNDTSIANLKRLKITHHLGVVFDDVP